MKKNIKILNILKYISILFLVSASTLVHAKLTQKQCDEKVNIQADRFEFSKKKYGTSKVANARNFYAWSMAGKELYEGECSHLDIASGVVYDRKSAMRKYGLECEEYGIGSNCNVTSLDEFYSGYPMQGLSRSNQNKINNNNDNQFNEQSNDNPQPTKKLTAAELKKQKAGQHVLATTAYAKTCKPSAELIDSYMEARTESNRLSNRPDTVSSDVIKANSIETIKNDTDGTSLQRYYDDLNNDFRILASEVDARGIASVKANIAWDKLRIETKLCLENRAQDPSLYQSGYITKNNDNLTQSTDNTQPTKKLTTAELKKQKAQQQIEEKMSESQQLAESTQAKADVARQGKRKTHDPGAVASKCIKVNRNGTYGSLDNVCNFKIHYVECHYQSSDNYLVCEMQHFGAGSIGPHKQDLSLVKNVEAVYWFACKDPAWPLDHEFIDNAQGRGISARCAEPGKY